MARTAFELLAWPAAAFWLALPVTAQTELLKLPQVEQSQSTILPNPLPPNPAEFDPAPHLIAAASLTRAGQYAQALKAVEKALEFNPSLWEAHHQRALIHQLMGNRELAIKEYSLLIERKPDFAQSHINLASLLARENPRAAEDHLKRAIAIYYFRFEPHFNLANLLIAQGRLMDALKEYKICLKLKPDNGHVHNNIGVLYLKRAYLEEAEEEFRKATHLEPANKMFHDNLELVRKMLRATPKALAGRDKTF